jgi:LEA14-like dessication related protein
MKKLSLLLLAVLLVFGYSACTSTAEIIAGDLKVALARIERAADGTVQVTWRVDNPNVVSYLISKGTHKILLNGTLVGTIVQDKPLGVPPHAQMERTGVLAPANPAAATIIAQAVTQGSAAYRVDSTIMLLILDDEFEKVHITYSGTVPVVAK